MRWQEWTLIASIILIFILILPVRLVDAEDECADPTWVVRRTVFGLLCVIEGGPIRIHDKDQSRLVPGEPS